MAFGQMHGQLRSALETSAIQDERTVGIDDVLLGAVGVVGRGVFDQPVAIRDPAVFGDASGGTPTAVRHAQGDRGVERTSIDAGLSAGDDAVYATANSGRTRVQTRLSGECGLVRA